MPPSSDYTVSGWGRVDIDVGDDPKWMFNSSQEGGNDYAGVSGGIDSAVTSTLCARTGKPVKVLNMPICQAAAQVCAWRRRVTKAAPGTRANAKRSPVPNTGARPSTAAFDHRHETVAARGVERAHDTIGTADDRHGLV